MSELFATDPAGGRHAQQAGNPGNPISLQDIFDDWEEGNWGLGKTVSPEHLAALCNLPTERIQSALDKAFENWADEMWNVYNGIRQEASEALLKDVGAS